MEKTKTILIIALILGAITGLVALGQVISNSAPLGFITIANVDPADIDTYFENGVLKEEFKDEINENIDQVPDFVLDMFAEGKTNVTLITTDGEELEFNVLVKGKELVGAQKGHANDADAVIKVNEDTLKKIINSDEPIEVIAGALNSGEIKYEALTPQAKLKEFIIGIISFFLGLIMALFSFFKSIFGG